MNAAKSPAERQAARRERKQADGLVQVAGFVPADQADKVRLAMCELSRNRQLTLQVLHDRDGRPYFIPEPIEVKS